MKYYSEITKGMYDNEEDLNIAEEAQKIEASKQEEFVATAKADKEELENVINDLRNECNDLYAEYEKVSEELDEAVNKYAVEYCANTVRHISPSVLDIGSWFNRFWIL